MENTHVINKKNILGTYNILGLPFYNAENKIKEFEEAIDEFLN